MSGRGGKRRQVLQLGSASKLHRYGYSKQFHSKEKKGKGIVTSLVGEFSDSDSEGNEDIEEQTTRDGTDEEHDGASEQTAVSGDYPLVAALPDCVEGSVIQDKPSDMDDELKNFLSEIEAIPMPAELNGSDQVKLPDSEINHESHIETVEEAPKPVTKIVPSRHHYSMFVKGESEFVHSPKQEPENSHTEIKEEDYPEEPSTDWQMVQDESTQYLYYWNTVTNEVTWEIPTQYTQFLLLHREYEEKIARYSPEQLEKLKEKHSKAAAKDPSGKHSKADPIMPHSGHAVQAAEGHSINSSALHSHDGKSVKVSGDAEQVYGPMREVSPAKSLSPRPEAGQDTRHKHKKEKRSHHKKKHKRRHGDSDDEKRSPKASDLGHPVMSSESSDVQIVSGCKLTSIVPYLSDQDDSDEDENLDLVPQLGPVTAPVIESKIKKNDEEITDKEDSSQPDQSLTTTSTVSQNLTATDPPSLELLSQTIHAYPTTVLLPPPPPPPLEEEPTREKIQDDIPDFEKNITDNVGELETNEDALQSISQTTSSEFLTDSVDDSAVEQFDDKDINSDGFLTDFVDHSFATQLDHDEVINVIADPSSSTFVNADPITRIHTPENESSTHSGAKQESSAIATQEIRAPEKSKCVSKEVIDMFADYFPLPASSQTKDVALLDPSVNTENTIVNVVKEIEPLEEAMEEGEILEVSEKETVVQVEKHKAASRAQENNSEIISESVEKKPLFKSINIVGYASDDEEEEGEVREKVFMKDEKVFTKDEKAFKVDEHIFKKDEKVYKRDEKINKRDEKNYKRDERAYKTGEKRDKKTEKRDEKIDRRDENIFKTGDKNSKKDERIFQKDEKTSKKNEKSVTADEKTFKKSEKSVNIDEKFKKEKSITTDEKSSKKGEKYVTTDEKSSKKGEKYVTTDEKSSKKGEKYVTTDEKSSKKGEKYVTTDEKSSKKGEKYVTTDEKSSKKGEKYVTTDEKIFNKSEKSVITDKKAYKKEENSVSLKHKKDKNKDQKKHRKDPGSDFCTVENRPDSKKVKTTDLVTLSQVIPKIASQEVPVIAVKVLDNEQDDDADIEFDIDDIDRALEIALEKNLEKKKVEQQAKTDDKENRCKDEVVNSTTPGELGLNKLVSDVAIFQSKNGENLNNNNNNRVIEASTDRDNEVHPVKKTIQDSENEISEQDEIKRLAEIKEMAELALNKLEFLDISTDNLSRLQVLFIELQTRHTDWTAGGLSTQYFYEQLKIAEGLLEQYELSAVPDGWACQWDRANNRYYYRNAVTNRIQWEYPEGENKEKEESQDVAVNDEESVVKIRDRGTDEHRRSRGSGTSTGRHRKKRDDKEKNKRDRRSSSRHYHRKRRRGRDQSNSSNSSGESQQHRRHAKSKKKKRHRAERSPSVEIVEHYEEVDVEEIIDDPSISELPETTSDNPVVSIQVDVDGVQDELDVALGEPPSLSPLGDCNTAMELNLEVDEEDADGASIEEVNTAVISKPPQILIHPTVIAVLNPDALIPTEMIPAPQTMTSSSVPIYPPFSAAQLTEQALLSADLTAESSEASLEADKYTKKKKKDKKSLATGSSIMMKKKHMSSMVQKWQKVKIEVEKEDLAKELRQAAIRKKIEELKSTDKHS